MGCGARGKRAKMLRGCGRTLCGVGRTTRTLGWLDVGVEGRGCHGQLVASNLYGGIREAPTCAGRPEEKVPAGCLS